ncbi:MAG: hypothetical protein ACXABO_07440 [Promethearchaeota archaeon]|jgi:hypothetical protein
MTVKGVKIHRKISWILALSSLTFISYNIFGLLFGYYNLFYLLHMIFEFLLIGSLIIHCLVSHKYLKLWWDRIIKGLKSKRARPIYLLRVIQLLSNRTIVILAFFVGLTSFGYFGWYSETIGKAIPFAWHRGFELYLSIFIIAHISIGFKFLFIRKRIKHWESNLFLLLFSSFFIFLLILFYAVSV